MQVFAYVFVCVHARVCICLCLCDREREIERLYMCIGIFLSFFFSSDMKKIHRAKEYGAEGSVSKQK